MVYRKYAGWCRIKGNDDLVTHDGGCGPAFVFKKGVNYRYDFDEIPKMYDSPKVVIVFIGGDFMRFSKANFKKMFIINGT